MACVSLLPLICSLSTTQSPTRTSGTPLSKPHSSPPLGKNNNPPVHAKTDRHSETQKPENHGISSTWPTVASRTGLLEPIDHLQPQSGREGGNRAPFLARRIECPRVRHKSHALPGHASPKRLPSTISGPRETVTSPTLTPQTPPDDSPAAPARPCAGPAYHSSRAQYSTAA